jgi:acyl-CoA thioesterase-1
MTTPTAIHPLRRLLACLGALLLLLFAASLARSGEAPAGPLEPVYQPISDVPGLPRVLIIGDSVSCGYTLPLRAALAGVANVHRPPQNCGSTAVGLQNLDRWLGDETWDVIHFNHGLHDLSYEFSPGQNRDAAGAYARPDNGGHHRVAPEAYRANLTALVALLRAKAPQATLIFATTTPVPADLHHYVKGSEQEYNRIATEVMTAAQVRIDDLCAFAAPRLADIQEPGNPHFTAKGSQVLAEEIAGVIRAALAARAGPRP